MTFKNVNLPAHTQAETPPSFRLSSVSSAPQKSQTNPKRLTTHTDIALTTVCAWVYVQGGGQWGLRQSSHISKGGGASLALPEMHQHASFFYPLEDWHLKLSKMLFRLIFGRWLGSSILYNTFLLLSLSGQSLLYAQTYNSSQPSFAFNRILTCQSSGCTSDSGLLA